MDTSDDIERLIRLLDSDGHDANGLGPDDAQGELTALGRAADVVTPLVRALPGLGPFAQLCAVEIFQELRDSRAVAALITLLDSADERVREWSAYALADLRAVEAVPTLKRAWSASKARGDDPGEGEPRSLRSALTVLGARSSVRPGVPAASGIGAVEAWPSARLVEVLDELAVRDQVILGFTVWRIGEKGGLYYDDATPRAADLDFTAPWPAIVRQAHAAARTDALVIQPRGDLVAAIDWISSTDV
ncbi:HEAT repeat domain-containing protein [Amycolatopsis rhabdoformis]|uniref:HEAT repeat domain-containing protein n=1 Tax=Amycolatopsis rhabdoformis TaxID=1448059 RepID=A0ABZ1I027_9PSEU|nr:HEAT repeat domain-containing protein [Amycolatopsis rhabdoformis]WSE27153.1 HEAT repeat domain-containing protein [Amycolatopsis rhabdoformis]